MKLNTQVITNDGRIGTVCYNHLNGVGGVWGEHTFEMPEGGFGDIPEPEFMLRDTYGDGTAGFSKQVEFITEYEIYDQ